MNECEHHIKDTEKYDDRICVIIPTYNNAGTILQVLDRVMNQSLDIIVVNDGSTDATEQLLSSLSSRITIVGYKQNHGKGYALKYGFNEALKRGYLFAITLDSDGQHYPEDIPLFLKAHKANPDALIIGDRGMSHDNMPKGSTFANRFSNFWFYVQTGQHLSDTQTGFRLYPLRRMRYSRFITSRYEAELELLVFSAWSGVQLIPVGIRVYYPPAEQRVTHFRPFADFARISILNTVLSFLCVFFWLSRLFTIGKRRKNHD
jgi:glycosyltransferase involved in cell wall biosynthesis